jgi:UDP-N-acetylglucosamine 4,6-dehydratase
MLFALDMEIVSLIVNNKTVLITGGTGTFGHALVEVLLARFSPKKVIVFSRDEFKQSEMRKRFDGPNLRYFIGDVRDYDRLLLAFNGVDIVFHAAALKHVPVVEYNPTEAIRTNIYGTENVIRAAICCGVSRVVAVSTDKCVNPVNLYGATKLCLEKLAVAANHLSGKKTLFSVVRYGNVLGSRGSVVPIFLEQRKRKRLTVTDLEMTRFTLTIQDAISFVLNSAGMMIGGEIFVPKLPSYSIRQLVKLLGRDCQLDLIGLRPGEKIHELMVSQDESHLTIDCGSFYVITSSLDVHSKSTYEERYGSNLLPSMSEYRSGSEMIGDETLQNMIDSL